MTSSILPNPLPNYLNAQKPPLRHFRTPCSETTKEDVTAGDMPRSGKRKTDERVNSPIYRKVHKFSENPGSTVLDLSYLPLDKKYLKDITEALIKRGETESLILRACLTPGSFSQWYPQFEHERPIKNAVRINRVDVSLNRNIGIDDARSLGTLLKMWNTKYLDLSECPLQNQEIIDLKKCLKDNFQLTTLVYNGNKITNQTMESLCDLASSISVMELHIGNCNLNQELLTIMERHMQKAKVKTLDLSSNTVMSRKAYEIIGRIVRKSNIDTVLFVDCKMKYDDLISFQRGLDGNHVAKLDLSYNRDVLKFPKGAQTLGLNRMTRLRLSGCKLNGSVLRKVASEIKLGSLDVTDNPKLCEDVQIIKEVIEEFGTKLEMSQYGWTRDEISQLEGMDTESGGGIKMRN